MSGNSFGAQSTQKGYLHVSKATSFYRDSSPVALDNLVFIITVSLVLLCNLYTVILNELTRGSGTVFLDTHISLEVFSQAVAL